MNSYERVMATLEGREHDRTPVSMMTMAWAGHAIGKTYRDYCLDPEVTVAAHLALVRDFGMDTVTVQTDPWCEAEAYGMRFTYPEEGVGIPEGHLLHDDLDLSLLAPFDPWEHTRPRNRLRAIKRFAEELKGEVPIIGWVEGPLAEYADLRGLEDACIDLMEEPEQAREAMRLITDNAIRFALAQLEAGADIIGIGDAAASVIGPDLYAANVRPFEEELFARIRRAGGKTKVHICGNISRLIPHFKGLAIDILDLDWMVSMTRTREILGEHITLCGNFNPVTEQLQCSPETARAAAERCIAEGGKRFILQGGCETPPGTPADNVRAAFTGS
jgi:MtaA/CmuA family methyltransferase